LTWKALLLIPLIGELFLFALALAFLLSAMFVKFRDINYIWEVVMQGAFYATPILYPISYVIDNVSLLAAKILMLNPIAQIIQDARQVLITPATQTIAEVYSSTLIRLVPLGMAVVLVIVSGWYFRSRSKYFAEEI
jgi:ABC-2 type transport system permease protein